MTLLIALAVLAVGIALWGLRRAGDPVEYFAAGHRGGTWIVGVAGTAAAVSAFTFIGGPGEFAAIGVGSLWIVLSAPLTGALQCWAVGERIVEMVKRHDVLTPQELLGARFGPPVRAVAGAVIVLGCIAFCAVQVRATTVVGETFLGMTGTQAAIAVMAATTLYTALGGMRSGLIADAFMGAVMAGIAVVLAAAALAAAGGPTAAVRLLADKTPELLGSFGKVPHSRAVAWFMLFCLGTCAQPHYLQKFFFLRSKKALRGLPAVLTGALAATLMVWFGVGLAGMALLAKRAISIEHFDQLMPRVMTLLGPWAVLLAAIAVLAALISTTASFLNLAAAALTRDLPEGFGRPAAGLGAARISTVLVAAAATGLGLASERTVAMFGVAAWGFFTAAFLPVFTVGLAWRRASDRGVMAAMLVGALSDIALETIAWSAGLPGGLQPGLVGAALGTLVLIFL